MYRQFRHLEDGYKLRGGDGKTRVKKKGLGQPGEIRLSSRGSTWTRMVGRWNAQLTCNSLSKLDSLATVITLPLSGSEECCYEESQTDAQASDWPKGHQRNQHPPFRTSFRRTRILQPSTTSISSPSTGKLKCSRPPPPGKEKLFSLYTAWNRARESRARFDNFFVFARFERSC